MKTLSKAAHTRIKSSLRNPRKVYSTNLRDGFETEICTVRKKDLQLLLDLALEINKQHA